MTKEIHLFEYFLHRIRDWYCQYHSIDPSQFNTYNDLSKLKAIKLHFFACSTYSESLNIFSNFYAMPFGHVESTVYNGLGDLVSFTVDRDRSTNNPINSVFSANNTLVNNTDLRCIDIIVDNLKGYNPSIIAYSPFDLVELSHKWFSWQHYFSIAQKNGNLSERIHNDIIKAEYKYYNL